MDKNIIIGAGIVALAGGVAFYVYKNRDALFPQAAPTVVQGGSAAPAPSISAMTTTYSPIPIGAVTAGQMDRSPPGVNPTGLEIEKPSSLNGNSTTPAPIEAPRGGSDMLVETSGNAALPLPQNPNATPGPSLTGNAAIVNAKYRELFGRDAEEQGLAFWAGQMDKGIVTADSLVRDLTQGAQGSDLWNEVVLNPNAVIAHRR